MCAEILLEMVSGLTCIAYKVRKQDWAERGIGLCDIFKRFSKSTGISDTGAGFWRFPEHPHFEQTCRLPLRSEYNI